MRSPAPRPHARLTSIRKWIAGALALVLAVAVGVLTTGTSHATGGNDRDWCPTPGSYPGLGDWGAGDWLATDNAPALFVGGNLVSSNMEHEGLTVVYGNTTFSRTSYLGVVGVGSGIVPSEGEAVLRAAGDVHVEGGPTGTTGYLHITDPSHKALIGGTYSYTGTAPNWALAPVTDKLQDEALGPWTGIDGAVTEISGNLAAVSGNPAEIDADSPRILHLPGNGGVVSDDMTFLLVDGESLAHVETLDFTGIPTGNGPIVVNVKGAAIDWTPSAFMVDGLDITDPKASTFGNYSSRIIWNFYEAETLNIHGTNQVPGSILVPNSAAKVVSNPSTNGRFYVNGDLTLTSLFLNGDKWNGMEHHNYPWMLRAWPGQCEDPSAAPLRINFTKTLTGDDPAGLDPDELFEFTLTPEDPAGIKIGSTRAEISVAELIAAGDSGVQGHFVDWGFTEAHSPYTLTLAETGGTNPHIGYDGTKYTVTVTVDRDLAGNLQPTLKITKVGDPDATVVPAVFTNNVGLPLAVDLPVTKRLAGENPTTEDYDFTFDFAPVTDYGEAFQMPADPSATVTIPAGDHKDPQVATLHGITVTEPGTYEVVVTERNGGERPIEYSRQQIHALITATRDDAGKWTEPTIEYIDGLSEAGSDGTFVNVYDPMRGVAAVPLEVTKYLVADDGGIPESQFDFHVVQNDADPAKGTDLVRVTTPADASVTMDKAGSEKATFAPITIEHPGTYTFAITELPGDIDGMEYDARTITATVVAEPDPASSIPQGIRTSGISYQGGQPDPDDSAKENGFVNEYTSIQRTLQVAKHLEADPGMPEATFEFTMAPHPDNPVGATMPASTTATTKMTETGKTYPRFDAITFAEEGTYLFDITETAGDMDPTKMTYDDAVVTARVEVTRNEDTGALESWITYSGGATHGGNAFVNTWDDPQGYLLARTTGGSTTTTATPSSSYPLARTGAKVLGVAATAGALILIGAALAYQRRRENGDF